MSSWILSTVTAQLPSLIEKYEPKIESSLKEALTKLKVSNPSETKLFYANWKKLNKVVDQTLADIPVAAVPNAPEPIQVDGGKRTRRKGRKQRKHRKY